MSRPKSIWGFVFLLGAASAALSCAVGNGPPFPQDRSVGTLMVADPALGGAWSTLGEARGGVAIPTDRTWGLKVDPEAARDLAFLTRLDPRRLEMLDLSGSSIDDDGLAAIEKFAALKRLNLRKTRVGDAGMERLAKLKKLDGLDLSLTAVGDAGLAKLRGLGTTLRDLNLSETRVTDSGLATLEAFQRLRMLDLGYTTTSDAGLAHLSGLKDLEVLYLQNTKIGDPGMTHFMGLEALQQLEIFGTAVTKKGADALRSALPECRIKM